MIRRSKAGRVVDQATKDLIIQEYRSELASCADIAKKYGVDASYPAVLAKRHGVPLRRIERKRA